MNNNYNTSNREQMESSGRTLQSLHDNNRNNNDNNPNTQTLLLPISLSKTGTTSRSSGLTIGINDNNNDNDLLPTNVCTEEQLKLLPIECLSNTANDAANGSNSSNYTSRPLRHVHIDGITITTYSLRPIQYSVLFILIIEVLERFSFYSINYTQTSYLTGQYNTVWNAQMDSISASSYVSVSVAIAYTSPFIGALLGDKIFGEYYTIVFGCLCLYWPGLLLIALSTIPHFFHMQYFNHTILQLGLLLMMPIGSGIVKSVVNIFGAKQFHPLLQSSLIEIYYINFYMCINIGALAGGIIVPIIASQYNVSIAYFLPVLMLFIGICVFLLGTSRYVQTQSKIQSINCTTITNVLYSIFRPTSTSKIIQTNDKATLRIVPSSSKSTNKKITPYKLFCVFVLIVPFCVSYSQMPTTFIIQGTVMKKACYGYIDAVLMYNNDTISVLVFGSIISTYLYPALAQRKIKIPTTYKFAIGSFFAFCAIAWALFVDYMIHTTYNKTGDTVSVLYQAPSYILIGIGEIFAISSAYEVAFTASPSEMKVLSSAINIFCVGGIPNVICIGLFQLCKQWFVNSYDNTTNISTIETYASAHVYKYFIVLLLLSTSGVIINILPSVKEYVESIEETSIDLIKTPKTPKTPMLFRQGSTSTGTGTGGTSNGEVERAALLKQQRHDYYMKYGSTPSLYHANSMHAGVISTKSIDASTSTGTAATVGGRGDSNDKLKKNQMKKTIISKLYQTTASSGNNNTTGSNTTAGTKKNVIGNQYVQLNEDRLV